MSTVSPTSSGLTLQPRGTAAGAAPAPAGGPVSSAGFGALDPIKLLTKYKWLLAAGVVVGAVLGFVGNKVWASTYPIYRSSVLFQCSAPVTGAGVGGEAGFVDVEMTRFMGTEARQMTSDSVLNRVLDDPDITDIKKWSAPFIMSDGSFNDDEALKKLRKTVSSRVISQTVLLELTATFTDRYEASLLAGMVKEKYLLTLSDQNNTKRNSMTATLRINLDNINAEIKRLEGSRESIIKDNGIESLDDRVDATSQELGGVTQELLNVSMAIEALRKQQEQMESEFQKPGGVTYSDELKGEVERDPMIIDIKQRISGLEQQQQAMRADYTPEHRYMKDLEDQIAGANVNLDTTRSTLLSERFDTQLDSIRNAIGQRQAQESRLNQTKTALTARRTDLSRIEKTLTDIDRQMSNALTAKAEATSKLEDVKMLDSLANANRVIVVQNERAPTEMAFPKLTFMLPLGVIMVVGLLGGSLFLKELLDQRVKGPADISVIPRTRLVGWIPDASQDPAGQGSVETAFRDRPRGVVAESYRQIRSAMTKRLEGGGHKSVMVMSGIPGSGSTATVANLGLAFAAADRRVLVVDANLRRPAMHRVFGLQESPGLADVLSGSVPLADAVQSTSTPNLWVLTAGTKDARIPERLGNEAASTFLADAKGLYDLVLLDAPPAIVAGDGISLAHRCDAAILVVKAFGEKRGLVARVRNELSDMKGEFLGVIVNSVKASAGGYMKGNFKAAQEYQGQA